jgi:glucose/arabinose dehydrogenase
MPATLILLAGLFACFFCAKPGAAVPGGFEDTLVTDVPLPTALDFAPDGRLLVTSKSGQLWVYEGNKLQDSPALDIGSKVCDNSERGLLGLAVDPDFGTVGRNFIYLYYTHRKSGECPEKDPSNPDNPVNRVSRFVMSGDTVDPTTEKVLVDNIPSPNGNHNAGDLKFGKDGYLYISVGDGGCDYAEPTMCQYQNDASRDRHILLGKVLRITRNGSIPAGNPYTGSDSDRCNQTGRTVHGNNCQETFARGFRNPFRMAFDPDARDSRLFINDVGGQRWEEIDHAHPGADYGWNLCEGNNDNPSRAGSVNCSGATYTGPIHEYSHDTGCESVTGGAFVPDGLWPASYDDAYLYGDYVCNKIFMLTPNGGGGFKEELFADGLEQRGPVSITFGPYMTTGRALYYATFADPKGGEVRRIVYTEGNLSPVAVAETVGENYGPLTMNLDASKSSDPDRNEPLTYEWDFTSDGTVDATGATASHTYPSPGKYTVTLTVRDALGKASEPDTIEVFPGDTPPELVIESPLEGTSFRVGQQFTATGSATDAEGGPLSLEWEIRRHHDGNHFHPWASGTGDQLTFTAPEPEGLSSTNPMKNYLEVRLTATDSLGLSKTVVRIVRPKAVEVGFETQPSGLRLRVNGNLFRTPRTFVSWEGYALNVSAPRQRDRAGQLWGFSSWSDGGSRSHTITTPADPTTYVAAFKRLRR